MNAHISRAPVVLLALAITGAAIIVHPIAGQSPASPRRQIETLSGRPAAAGQVIAKFRALPSPEDLAFDADPDRDEEIGGAGARLIHSRSFSTAALVDRLSRRPDVEYVEPDYLLQADAPPNDPSFGDLWALLNVGQYVQDSAGTAGADIGARAAWEISTGSRAVVVAVVDTGVDGGHSDLAANLWAAPAPFTVSVGGRTVSCAAGTHGFDAIAMTCDPRDDHNHGTHVTGTVGAVGDNGLGVAGVNWTASVMALKFLDASGNGLTSDAINAIEFAVQAKAALGGGANVRVLTASWGGPGFSQALLDEIARADAADQLLVAAAGNAGTDNDEAPYYPASYAAPNVIAVAATDSRDLLAPFSNVGPMSVHLGAPGVDILSTVRGNAYAFASGTSMAVPHVAGAAALALSACQLTTPALKRVLLETVTPVGALAGRTVTGGRLDVGSALTVCASAPPAPDFALSSAPASISVKRGKTAVYTVAVSALNGFRSAVGLSVAGLPPGATASFSPASIAGAGTATLAVATGTKSRGTFTLTITGSAPGDLVRTASVTLRIS